MLAGRSRLPNPSNWCFDDIAHCDPDRAATLEAAGPPSALLQALGRKLLKAISLRSARFARERCESQPKDHRAVIQFFIGERLFDWFFNARTGYRAHFRAHYLCGLRFNDRLITELRHVLDAALGDSVPGHEVDRAFDNLGEIQIAKSFLLTSLAPEWAKASYCSKRIPDAQCLPLGIGKKIQLGDGSQWQALCPSDADCWLQITGAFNGSDGLYQPKCPIKRAMRLQKTGQI
jgi:hypothetical protein